MSMMEPTARYVYAISDAAQNAAGEERPTWAHALSRWEQLDPMSKALAHAWFHWQKLQPTQYSQLPSTVILASSVGSNAADLAFSRSGAASPGKFVATLPNVALSTLATATQWMGRLFCLVGDQGALEQALEEAQLLAHEDRQEVGVFCYDWQTAEPISGQQISITYYLFSPRLRADEEV